jgi:hypothetical protein
MKRCFKPASLILAALIFSLASPTMSFWWTIPAFAAQKEQVTSQKESVFRKLNRKMREFSQKQKELEKINKEKAAQEAEKSKAGE